MKRIIVLGSSGAGKTVFSRRLAEKLNLEVIHIDKIYWRNGWGEPADNEWRSTLKEHLGQPAWIMDGNFGGTIEMRLAACDTAIFLDIRRTLCLWRVVRRTFRFYKRTRPDMADGCPERFDWKFLGFIWNYPKKNKPRIEKLLDGAERTRRVIRLRSPGQVRAFLRSL